MRQGMKAYLYIILQLIQIYFSKNRSLFTKVRAEGYSRGVDFYNPLRLLSTLVNSGIEYKRIHGQYPNLVNPKYFNEKIFYKKFFCKFKIPESGNKLLTHFFIPASLKNRIYCPEIVWHSPIPKLPANCDVPAGHYYLKASHGSDMFAKVKYPLTGEEVFQLETKCSRWLENKYGFWTGEWWYCTFQKEILLEKSISNEKNSVAIGFYVFKGVVKFIILNKKVDDISEITWLDENFNPTTYQSPHYNRVSNFSLVGDMKKLKYDVIEVAGDNDFVRVDLLLGDDGKYYLGEMTFSPGNALSVRPDTLEIYLGSAWTSFN